MPIYTFYPRRADGSSITFEAVELASDEMAALRAARLLKQHANVVSVDIWEGERQVTQAAPTQRSECA